MSGNEILLMAVGVIAGYYVVSHYLVTRKAV